MNSYIPLMRVLAIPLFYLPIGIAQENSIFDHTNNVHIRYNGGTGQTQGFSTFSPNSSHQFTDNVSLTINKDLNFNLHQNINVNGPPSGNPGSSGTSGGTGIGGTGTLNRNLFFTSTLGIPTSNAFYYYQYQTPYRAYQWVAIDGGYWPDDAVVGGYDEQKNELYVCKTYYGDGMYVGQQRDGSCKIAYHGKEVDLDGRYGILAGMEYKWLPITTGWKPQNSDSIDGKSYVCRVHDHDGVYPGQLSGSVCHFVAQGKARGSTHYEILSTVPAAY